MTVSLEMFPNDEEGAADAAVEDADALLADGPEGITVAEGNAPAHDGTPAAAGGAGAQPGGDLGAPGGGGPGRPGIGPNGRPMQQTMVFVFGPEDFGFNVPLFNQAVPVPDPAKAAELLAALPTIGRPLLRRVDKIITAEDANSSKEEEERGWRCGICLEGLDVDADEPASAHPVKGLPCNHLFHEECLQPWFTSHFTW
jgi:hypothetical protein